jgi:ABC-type glycerol-3-phosphate transport system substrate-binding protein
VILALFSRKAAVACAFAALCVLLFFSCAVTHKKPLIIWTNRPEFASYIELFNTSQSAVKAIAIYKEFPAGELPAPAGEAPPDIIIAPGLKSQNTRALFLPLKYLFTEQKISAGAFYEVLFEQGMFGGKPYLLPVSFNLPAVIFDAENRGMIPTDHLITLEQMRELAARFNAQNKSLYTAMGFGPSWDTSFLYLAAKLKGARFKDVRGQLVWDEDALAWSVRFLRDWTLSHNSSTTAEEDFAFKYLYTPAYRQVTSGKCLFAYTTSHELFMIPNDWLQKIDFRWLHENFEIPVEDACVYMGILKKSNNEVAAEIFTAWFFQQETQRALMERSSAMRLNTGTFGIAGGFSALRQVTERVFPTYYPLLLGNLPAPDYLCAPEILPVQWRTVKEQAVIPYLADSCDTRNTGFTEKTMRVYLAEWNKRLF